MNASDLGQLLDMLEQHGVLGAEECRVIRSRSEVLRAEIKGLRGAGGRYEVSSMEIIAHAKVNCLDTGVILDEDRLAALLGSWYGYESLKIDSLKLNSKLVTETFSQAYARHNVVLPISTSEEGIVLAISDPRNSSQLQSLRMAVRSSVRFVISSKSDILQNIAEIYGFKSSVSAAALEHDGQLAGSIGNLERFVMIRNLDEIDSSDSHVVNAVEYLLNYAFSQRSSDIHIEPKREHSVIRLRIDGLLHTVYKLPMVVHAPVVSRLKSLARLDIAEKRKPQDGRLKTSYQGEEVELRMSTMPVAFGEKVVIRILKSSRMLKKVEDLGVDEENSEVLQSFLSSKTGLILVTGPTGSGKTTTLYAALEALYSSEVNITTIEDPIEIVVEKYNQVQVYDKIGWGFSHALRSVLRQDPDIVMIGEIRDEDTAEMAVQAALTGHLVLSTLHTNDSASAIGRLLDLKVKPFLLSSCLLGVVAQRLLRKICPHCKVSRVIEESEIQRLGLFQSAYDDRQLKIYEGKGCNHCRGTGYYEQCAVFEMLRVSERIRELINREASNDEILQVARGDGMMLLRENAIKKLALGECSLNEVVQV